MSRTYKAVGINLKSMPLGESDRLITILTSEFGLIRAVAPGARKHHSKLGGRSELFVVNELLIAKGRSLDKITQAESIESYPGLSKDLGKLAASQYLAEVVLCQALSEQPQVELFCLLNEYLSRLEQLPKTKAAEILVYLTHAVFHLLSLAGIKPQVQNCCLTQHQLTPDMSDPDYRVGFSMLAGGAVSLSALERLQAQERRKVEGAVQGRASPTVAEKANTGYQTVVHRQETPVLNTRLTATELALLQQLAGANIEQIDEFVSKQSFSNTNWLFIEQLLRQYTQYHFGRQIRSAALLDSYFEKTKPTSATNHDSKV